eukprot:4755985-Amphidinium_carterae.2
MSAMKKSAQVIGIQWVSKQEQDATKAKKKEERQPGTGKKGGRGKSKGNPSEESQANATEGGKPAAQQQDGKGKAKGTSPQTKPGKGSSTAKEVTYELIPEDWEDTIRKVDDFATDENGVYLLEDPVKAKDLCFRATQASAKARIVLVTPQPMQ